MMDEQIKLGDRVLFLLDGRDRLCTVMMVGPGYATIREDADCRTEHKVPVAWLRRAR